MTFINHQGWPVEGDFRAVDDYHGNFCSGIENVYSLGNTNVLTYSSITSSSHVGPPLDGGRKLLICGQADLSQSDDIRKKMASSIAHTYGMNISDQSFPQEQSMLPSPPVIAASPLQLDSDYLLALSHLMETDDIPGQPDDDKLNTRYAVFSKLIHKQPDEAVVQTCSYHTL
ncbi:hypothetical protein CRYUN_Cryun01aG0234300 [Craigia yunnanensis]